MNKCLPFWILSLAGLRLFRRSCEKIFYSHWTSRFDAWESQSKQVWNRTKKTEKPDFFLKVFFTPGPLQSGTSRIRIQPRNMAEYCTLSTAADRTKTMLIGAKLVVLSYLDSQRGHWFMDPWTLIQSIHFPWCNYFRN